MLTAAFNPREEKDALYAVLCRFHAQWEQQPTVETVLDLCDATERAQEVLTALSRDEAHQDTGTRLQVVCLKILLNSAIQALESLQDEPVATIKHYPTSEEQPVETPTAVFPRGTILSCPACGEGLYKVKEEATTNDLILDDGTLLLPLNRDIPARDAWKPLACPKCGGRLLKNGQLHTFQQSWR